jgi:hypothetical protein
MKSISKNFLMGFKEGLSISEIIKINKINTGIASQLLLTLTRQDYLEEQNLVLCSNCLIKSSCKLLSNRCESKFYSLSKKGEEYLNEKAKRT